MQAGVFFLEKAERDIDRYEEFDIWYQMTIQSTCDFTKVYSETPENR